MIGKFQRELRTLKGQRVALLGISFRPDTEDLREAASLQIARRSDSLRARAIGYYLVAAKAAARRRPSLKVVFDPYKAAEGTHAAVVVSEWEEVRTQELERVSALMQEPKVLVDGRNPFEPAAPREAGAPGALSAAMRRGG